MCLPAQEVQRRAFDPWVGKILWRRTWQPTSVFLPGESMGRGAWRATVCGVTKSWTRLSTCACACAHPHTHTRRDCRPRHHACPLRRPDAPSLGSAVCVCSLQCFINAVSRHLHTGTVLPPSCRQVESFFFFFSCLIAMTRTSSGVLNTDGESGHPYLVPEL